jgi:CBS domain-containing protein
MTTIGQLLREKGHKIHSVSPDSTVYDAIRKMAEENIGSLVVMEGDKIVGIITERHYARNVVLKGRASPATRVRDIMEQRVLYAKPDQSIEECMDYDRQEGPPSSCHRAGKGDGISVDWRSGEKYYR